jgi:hypothetical protein
MPTVRPPFVGEVMPRFADKRCHVVSVTDPYGRILDLLDRSRSLKAKNNKLQYSDNQTLLKSPISCRTLIIPPKYVYAFRFQFQVLNFINIVLNTHCIRTPTVYFLWDFLDVSTLLARSSCWKNYHYTAQLFLRKFQRFPHLFTLLLKWNSAKWAALLGIQQYQHHSKTMKTK